MKTLALIILLALPCLADVGNKTITISGQVFYRPLPGLYFSVRGAQVRFNQYATTTNVFGYYSINIPNRGKYVGTVRAKGLLGETHVITLPIPETNHLYIYFLANEQEFLLFQ